MENNFSIKNFRVFNEKGATFNIRPISFLTGTNSSGKSSLTKAIMLMKEFLSTSVDNAFDPIMSELDFASPSLKLGGFRTEKNRASCNNELTFSFSVSPSCAPSLSFDVGYSFVGVDGESFLSHYDNGKLSKIVVRLKESTIMEVHVEEDLGESVYKIETINLLDPEILSCFEWFYRLIIYVKARKGLADISDAYGIPVNGKRSDELKSIVADFHQYAESQGIDSIRLAELDDTEIRGVLDALLQSNSFLAIADLKDAFEKYHSSGSFFYFSISEESDEVVKEILQGLRWSVDGLKNMIERFCSRDENPLLEKTSMNIYPYSTDRLITSTLHNREKSILGVIDARIDIHSLLSDSYMTSKLSFNIDDIERFQKAFERIMQSKDQNSPETIDDIKDLTNLDPTIARWYWRHDLFPQSAYDFLCFVQSLFMRKRGMFEDPYIKITEEIDNSSPTSSISLKIRHKLYSAYCDYFSILMKQILFPESLRKVVYLGDSHENIKRVYSLSDRSDSVVVKIINYLRVKDEYEKLYEKQYPKDSFISSWLSKLGIGSSFDVIVDSDRMTATLLVNKDVDKNESINLANEGYGVFQLVVLLLSIETELLNYRIMCIKDGKRLRGRLYHPDMYLPKLTVKPITFILEEPEANLHPAYQSRLAEILFSAYKESHGAVHFIVETHSEYLVRATQAIVAKTVENEDDLKKIPFVVFYLEKGGEVYDMEYQLSGRFKRPFGTGFFDEAGKSAIEILRKERRMKDEESR